MNLDKNTRLILERLQTAGFRAGVVGGAVRNHLLGIPLSDIDITTSATPEMVKKVFLGERIIDTGIAHGTVTLVLDGTPYEITTFRTEGEYKDNRHPSSVSFTDDLALDLSRRDFTVNAMFYSPKDGYVDLFGGMDDLSRGVIRAVGDPTTRFNEDALRILRAIRFASVLGFSVESETSAAVQAMAGLLDNVSRERIYTEWRKLIGGKGAYEILAGYPDVVLRVLCGLEGVTLPDKTRFLSAEWDVRQLSLFYLGNSDPVSDFDRSMRELRSDNATRTLGVTALSILPSLDLGSAQACAEAIYKYGYEQTVCAAKLGVLVGRLSEADLSVFDLVHARKIPTRLSELNLRGGDISAIGARGKQVGVILDSLMLSVIRGELLNLESDLINAAQKLIK